jgi:hypothetical protein
MKPKNYYGIPERIHENFLKELDEIAVKRIKNDLEIDKVSIKELTRMTLNTDNWKNCKKELETKPRIKDE